jgi:hypothetical protein
MKRRGDFTLGQGSYKMKKRHKNQVKKSKLLFFFLNLGKIILEATKLIFGSLVLGTIIKGDIPQSTLLLAGIIASGFGVIFGTILLTFGREE